MPQLKRIVSTAILCLVLSVYPSTIVSAQTTGEVAVTAKVALSPQHIFGIQKNSQLLTSLSKKTLKPGDNVDFSIVLNGLQNQPQRNREVSLLLRADNNPDVIKLTQLSDSDGLAHFKLPIGYHNQFLNYSVNFFTYIEGKQIDLFNSLYIKIIGTSFSLPKNLQLIPHNQFALPLGKIIKIAYSLPLIFVTLKGIEKLYGFAKKTIAKPAVIFAAARDGPVVVCDAYSGSNQRSNTFSRKSR